MTKLIGDQDVYIGEIKSVDESAVGFDQSGMAAGPKSNIQNSRKFSNIVTAS